MLSLVIHHNIHLTRDERYKLHDGQDVIITGVSVPVWVKDKVTTEPAREVFCRYYLKNPKKEIPIKTLDDGYEICLPHRAGTNLNITDEEWQKMHLHNPERLEMLYGQCIAEVSSKNLLDIKDGGCGILTYREYNKVKSSNTIVNVMHFVSLADIQKLNDSLTN